MARQGCCVVSPQDAGEASNVLDRLEGLSKVIPPELMEQTLLETGRGQQKACRLSHGVMLWVVLAMGVLTHLPIRQVFKHARRMRPGEKTPSRSNLCEGRQRLGVEPVRRVFELVVRPLATPQTRGGFYKGLRPMGIDGTVQDVPDTPANAAHFGRSSGGRGAALFRKFARSARSNWVRTWKWPWPSAAGTSEQKVVGHLFGKIPGDALLIEDRGASSSGCHA